jgi:hypothetical protein
MAITSFTYSTPVNFTATATQVNGAFNINTSFVVDTVPITSPLVVNKAELERLFGGLTSTISNDLKTHVEGTVAKTGLLAKMNASTELDKQWSALLYTLDIAAFNTDIALVFADVGSTPSTDSVEFVFKFSPPTGSEYASLTGNYYVAVRYNITA